MKSVQTLIDALKEEIDLTSDISPVVTVSRRNLRTLIEFVEKEYSDND